MTGTKIKQWQIEEMQHQARLNSRRLEELARKPIGLTPYSLSGKRPRSSDTDEPVRPGILG
jgi:hypothetical protein